MSLKGSTELHYALEGKTRSVNDIQAEEHTNKEDGNRAARLWVGLQVFIHLYSSPHVYFFTDF
jgi:hypothetical protein